MRYQVIVLLIVLSAPALAEDWELSCQNAEQQARERALAVQRLSDEVSLLNLLRGIYLSDAQAAAVIALAREAENLRDSTFAKESELLAEYGEALGELRARLAEGNAVPPELEKEVQAKELAVKQAKDAYFEQLRFLEKRLREALTDAQIAVAEGFDPCIIPPQELKDPVRVGQAESPTRDVEEHLETLRNLPDEAWEPVAGVLFDVFLSFEETLLGKFEPEARRAEIERLFALARNMRALSDEDFEFEKGRLAADVIQPIRNFQAKSQELVRFFLQVSGGLTKVGKYLLDPRVATLLDEMRAARPESGGPGIEDVEPVPPRTCGGNARPAGLTIETLGPEPRFAELAQWLALDEEEVAQARPAIARAQAELLTLLAAKRDDGRNILAEFLRSLFCGKEADAFALLSLKAPGGRATYMERIGEIKSRAESKLEASLDTETFEKYRSSGVDLFKIKVGSLRWKE